MAAAGPLVFWLLLGQTPLERAVADLRAGRTAQAEQALVSLAEQDTNSPDPPFYLGVLYLGSGRLERALENLNRAVKLSPRRAAAWKALGAAYAAQNRYSDAEGPLRTACALDAGEELACYYWGRNLYSQNRFEEAREAFEKALKAERPAHLWLVHRGLAQACEALGKTAPAEQHFREAIRLAGSKPRPDEDPGIDYGIFLIRQARLAEARGPLQDAVKRLPNSARARFEYARLLVQENDLEGAATHLAKAVELEPEMWAAHLLLGRVYFRLGRTAEGERHLRTGEQGALRENGPK